MLKGQGGSNATSPANARKHSRGRSWAVLKDQDFNNLPLTHTRRHAGALEQRGQSKRHTVKGSRVGQPQRGRPPFLSEKMTLISQSLFRTREEAKRTKVTAEPKNSICCWDTWE